MRKQLAGWAIISFLVSLLIIIGSANAIMCPLCAGHIVKFCNVEIYPKERIYDQELTVNVTMGYLGNFTPIEKGTKVEIWYYGDSDNITKLKFTTDAKGLVKYTPKTVGHYLVKVDRYEVCEKTLLIYVNTTCGDGICGGSETLATCAKDCGRCGDGTCDASENLSCRDCAVCGDKKCTAGESRSSCLKDCVFCGDGICDYVENRDSCKDDCPSGAADRFCDKESDGLCDPDCDAKNDSDCEVPESVVVIKENPIATRKSVSKEDAALQWMLLAVILILVVTAVISSIIEIRKERKANRGTKKSQKKENKKKAISIKGKGDSVNAQPQSSKVEKPILGVKEPSAAMGIKEPAIVKEQPALQEEVKAPGPTTQTTG